MARQLTFDLPSKAALGRDDFFVSPANEHAVHVLENWAQWPDRKQILSGPAQSGKTHLAHVWAAQANGQIISAESLAGRDIAACLAKGENIAVEDIDQIAGYKGAQQALFHLHNGVLAGAGHLLMTTTTPPGAIPFDLPDIASRVQATNVVRLHSADDALLTAILVKLFTDRQLDIQPEVIRYLLSRMDRAFGDLPGLVAALDARALSERRAITIPLVRSVLDNDAPPRA